VSAGTGLIDDAFLGCLMFADKIRNGISIVMNRGRIEKPEWTEELPVEPQKQK
jgi:hypothetical protein